MSECFKRAKYLNPYVIAEIGVNHEGDLELAKEMIRQVAKAGGHAAKFQTYKAQKIASKDHSPSYWDLKEEPCTSQFSLFKKYDSFDRKEFKILHKECQKNNIDFLSTPFDLDSVDMLNDFVPIFKVASADLTNIPLLRKIASKKKPVVLSTGASSMSEIDVAIENLETYGASKISLLHCVLNYPTPKTNAQMRLLKKLNKIYGDRYKIGYSDHVKPNDNNEMPALEMATLSGACIIEKHFTYDKSLPGNDHYHSMDGTDLKRFLKKISDYQVLWGKSDNRSIELEASAVQNARRRIIISKNITKGEILSENNLIALRSNQGINIKHWDEVVGKTASRDLKKDSPLSWKDT